MDFANLFAWAANEPWLCRFWRGRTHWNERERGVYRAPYHFA